MGDFCGGLLSRWSSVLAAMLTSQGIGLVGGLIFLVLSSEAAPSQESAVWAVLAGVSGVAGLGFFYVALSRGTMGVVAPLAALIGAGVPVLVAVIGGEAIGPGRLLGIGVALVAVVLISLPTASADNGSPRSRRIDLAELPLVVLSGLGFAGFFLGIDLASEGDATWWPLVIVRVAGFSLVVAAVAIAVMRVGAEGRVGSRLGTALGAQRFRESGKSLGAVLPLFVITGAGDLGGNVFFVLARQTDALSVAVVLSSLYPVVTTLLAVIFLRERLSRMQLLGVVLATASVPLLR